MDDNIKIKIVNNYDQMSFAAFEFLKNEIKRGAKNIGLSTGSTPIGVYKNICIDFLKKDIYSMLNYFNLDEYHGLNKNHPQSYYTFMQEMLFKKINAQNCYIPNGESDISESINEYQNLIDNVEIDVQLLGIGTNGHIGFNEPGTPFDIKTNFVKLKNSTREANKRFFGNNIDEVPQYAITMGIADIMNAKKIIIIANGESKATAVREMLFGEITERVPASILQNHPDVTVIIDEKAASKLPLTSLSVDISSSRVKLGVFDPELNRVAFDVIDHHGENVYEKMVELTKPYLTNNIYKFCISVSGYVFNGVVTHEAIGFNSFNLRKQAMLDFRRDVVVVNRANASALGEHYLRFPNACSLYYLSLANGIGGGYVLNGEIVNGIRGLAGEISNMIIDNQNFEDNFFANGSAELHYKLCKETNDMDKLAYHLAVVIANIINTIDPEVIVLDFKDKRIPSSLLLDIEKIVSDVIYSECITEIMLHNSTVEDESLVGAVLYATKI